jgi:hypothetical protein
MTISTLNRRLFLSASGAALLSRITPASAQERSKADFMRQAVAAINFEANRQRAATRNFDIIDLEIAKKKIVTKNLEAYVASYVHIPRVLPFADWDYYYLDGPLHWIPNFGEKLTAVSVPTGFVTDLASVPSVLWSKYPPIGRYAYAAVIHDYLYWVQTGTREEADEILRAAMADAKVDSGTVSDFYNALSLFGGAAWNRNKEARQKGEKRILALFPPNPLISWAEWRKGKDVFK